MAAESSATTTWHGSLTKGSGTTHPQSGAFPDVEVTWASRTERSAGKTSPEELLAAAHGGCITMSLAGELTSAETPPGRLDVACTIVMDEVEGQGHQIVASQVTIGGDADGLNDELIERAHESCPFSTLLKNAGVAVELSRA
jgi:osmotically inducible protein OsmC